MSKTIAITVSKPKANRKNKKKNQKIARTRRQRGYNWEDTLVKRFNSVSDWRAFRLGSPSIALPDVLAVNTLDSSIFTIEAKSGTSTSLPVPADQIERCKKWTDTFDIYKKRNVILAFKFLSKKRVGQGIYENRELREFYKIWDDALPITDCVCTYDGVIYAKINGKREKIDLKDHPMPFKTKYRSSA
ncbi:resolvase [Nitrosopumilus sp. K4]|uniref:resolvase n=1 Tax=Nitrosopumilus sp. K4 TaxID=2795383 RepID=UPI0035303CF7